MDSLLSIFLLFIAAITALLTYMVVPFLPVVTLVSAAAITLAAGVWWHWTQFSTDYRTSTWQEQLRNYTSYALLLVVILLSYAFYVFAWSDKSLNDYAAQIQSSARNISRKVVSETSRLSSALLSEKEEDTFPTLEQPQRNRPANLPV